MKTDSYKRVLIERKEWEYLTIEALGAVLLTVVVAQYALRLLR